MREKERIKAEEAAKAEQERILAEDAEVRRIRQECNFKATPIKHYSMKLGHVPDKKLTVPREPKLQTIERAAMRQDMQDMWRLGFMAFTGWNTDICNRAKVKLDLTSSRRPKGLNAAGPVSFYPNLSRKIN